MGRGGSRGRRCGEGSELSTRVPMTTHFHFHRPRGTDMDKRLPNSSMGQFSVEFTLRNPQQKNRKKVVRALVDTGAMHSVIPQRILRELGIKPSWRRRYRVADGRHINRQVGIALFEIGKELGLNDVVFGKPRDPALLGMVTLENMALTVDPVNRRIVPLELQMISNYTP